jgi:long-chain acyl-CoA synthetase
VQDGSDSTPPTAPPIDVEATFDGANLIVIGATGFLGKVWVCLLLERYPKIGKLYTVVRAKKDLTPTERFWTEVAPSEVFNPLRDKYPGKGFEEFLREKIIPVNGDVSRKHLGLSDDLIADIKGEVAAIVNVAGVVDFNPPLDEALKVNAFGAQNLVELARTLGDVAVMHTSTCFVVGRRDGVTLERNTLEFPFPRADELDISHWDAEREIAECIDLVEQARRRVEDAPRQSHLLDEAKRNLERRHEPLRGTALSDELESVKRKFVRKTLIDAGKERAQFWGWPNIYTYTKSIGEQILLRSGLRVTIVRPSIVESAVSFPMEGWCEGISTSSPIMYLAYAGQQHIPVGEHCYYDAIPVDMCSAGMVASLAAVINDRHEAVYQYCSSDNNPLKTRRAGELIGLAKRRYYRSKSSGNQLVNVLQSYAEPDIVPLERWRKRSTPAARRRAETASRWLKKLHDSPVDATARNLSAKLDGYARTASNVEMVFEEFIPFITANEYRFSAANTRKLMKQLSEADQQRLVFDPESIDWHDYWLNVHQPGVEKWSIPLLKEKLRKEVKAQRRHDDLVEMLEDLCERHEHAILMQRLEGEELTRVTYADFERRSRGVAARLHARGVSAGDKVAIGGRNHPDWGIAYFGIIRLGAIAVPVDKDYEVANLQRVLEVSGTKIGLFDEHIAVVEDAPEGFVRWSLHEAAAEPGEAEADDGKPEYPRPEIDGEDVASILYTSGTTGDPKGVMLTHANFTALVAALAPVFPINRRDHLLSVLPLHHTFEFTCGFLLPFTRGARIIYLDEINGDRLVKGLDKGQVTSMIGVPALWELLERRIRSQVSEHGTVAEKTFDALLEFNRNMGKKVGFDLGRVLFSPIHHKLGGNLRLMISGAAALPPDVQKTFQGLGLHLSEGYGLTEAAPVLTVAKGSARAKPGHVGRAVPGVEVKIDQPNDAGVGEILARGPNVMKGYADDDEATAAVLEDGWLRTGDLGTIDDKDRLRIVGRSKEVIISSSGENVYPDDVEAALGSPQYIEELSIVGLPDEAGGERVACLAVPRADAEEKLARSELHQRALTSLRRAFDGKLPRIARPTIVHLTDAELPRTATRKVKRTEVRVFIERLHRNAQALKKSGASSGSAVVRNAIASIARREAKDVGADHDLAGDLGFDSLMVVELVSTLESALPGIPAEQISECRTVGDIEALYRRATRTPKSSRTQTIEREEDEDIVVPQMLVDPAKKVLTAGQLGFYEHVMQVKVRGQANIPQNRNTIVVANHASHIDMGLCKYALGNYGHELVALAAQDYFFKGKWSKAYVQNFTNMAALDRKSGLRKALTQAGEHLERGRTILIFPEGTRSDDGVMRDFMPLIGNLALNYGVDILPLYLQGTHKAFPKGTKVPVPRRRKVGVRIGVPLRIEDLQRLVEGKKRSASYREVAKLAQQAVETLRDGGLLDLSRPAIEDGSAETPGEPAKNTGMKGMFVGLEARFVPGSVKEVTSFYFSLGDAPDGKWNLELRPDGCTFAPGRPKGGKADCVLKTGVEIFKKIVEESYTPSVAEFMSGKVKSNDIQLLQIFQKAFDL